MGRLAAVFFASVAVMPAPIRLEPGTLAVVLEHDGDLPETAVPAALSGPFYLTATLSISCAPLRVGDRLTVRIDEID